MQINELKPIHEGKTRRRVGRGGKKGTYSGKGMKGQKSRAGRKMVPIIREVIKRYPKLKGYRAERFLEDTAVLNLGDLEKKFENGDTVNPKALLEKGLARRIKGREPKVKILGEGKLTKKLVFEGCLFSKTAKEAVEKLGGEIK